MGIGFIYHILVYSYCRLYRLEVHRKVWGTHNANVAREYKDQHGVSRKCLHAKRCSRQISSASSNEDMSEIRSKQLMYGYNHDHHAVEFDDNEMSQPSRSRVSTAGESRLSRRISQEHLGYLAYSMDPIERV